MINHLSHLLRMSNSFLKPNMTILEYSFGLPNLSATSDNNLLMDDASIPTARRIPIMLFTLSLPPILLRRQPS
jgi:hypothetical protein